MKREKNLRLWAGLVLAGLAAAFVASLALANIIAERANLAAGTEARLAAAVARAHLDDFLGLVDAQAVALVRIAGAFDTAPQEARIVLRRAAGAMAADGPATGGVILGVDGAERMTFGQWAAPDTAASQSIDTRPGDMARFDRLAGTEDARLVLLHLDGDGGRAVLGVPASVFEVRLRELAAIADGAVFVLTDDTGRPIGLEQSVAALSRAEWVMLDGHGLGIAVYMPPMSVLAAFWKAPVEIVFCVVSGLVLVVVMSWPVLDDWRWHYREYRARARAGAEDRALLELVDMPTVRWLPQDFSARYSPAWWRMLGLPEDEGCNDIDMLTARLAGAGADAARASYVSLAEGAGDVRTRLLFMRHNDGRTIPVEERARRLEDGRVLILHRPIEQNRGLAA